MKAIVIHAAKDLRIEEREPEVAGAGQVEIAIEAGGICGSDLHYYNHGTRSWAPGAETRCVMRRGQRARPAA